MAFKVHSIASALTLLCHLVAAKDRVSILPNKLHNGPLTAEMVAGTGSLDGLKLSTTANVTSYEWWYFDAVSNYSKNESINIVFYNAGSVGFPAGYFDGPLSVGLSGTFENGTLFAYDLPVTKTAVIVENHAGLTGDWKGTGARFSGSNLSHSKNVVFEVTVDSPDIGVRGKIKLHSVAPPRYPCNPNIPGTSEHAFLNVAWSNAVPDSNAIVDFNINGSPLRFRGLGYHDKNWGLSPFANDVGHTYWGHARVGPYSVVFSDAQIPAGGTKLEEKFSAMVARNGKFIELSCAEKAVVVRPWGGNDQYPPTIGSPPPLGLEITFQLGHEGVLHLNVTNDLVIIDEIPYQRFIGSVEGRVNGGHVIKGRALWEQFKMIGA